MMKTIGLLSFGLLGISVIPALAQSHTLVTINNEVVTSQMSGTQNKITCGVSCDSPFTVQYVSLQVRQSGSNTSTRLSTWYFYGVTQGGGHSFYQPANNNANYLNVGASSDNLGVATPEIGPI